jgi:hypothetical protein
VAEDYERALAAVREAARHDALPERSVDGAGSPLLTALWVLRQAGPRAPATAAHGRALAERLDGPLRDAAPAAGLGRMLRAGPVARAHAARAVAELRAALTAAEREGVPGRFAQTSVDLLRGQDGERAALAAATDFARDPAPYRLLLARLTGPADPGPREASRGARGRRWFGRRPASGTAR